MTRRQRIIDLLKNPISFQEIANQLGIPIKFLKDDFYHISKTIKLEKQNAFCKKCNFKFTDDKRFHTPSKCPKCKSEWIQAQKFKRQSD